MDRAELMNRMAVLLGGRAAETLVFDDVSTGASDDLAKATEIARSMVVRFGMNEKLGQVAYEPEGPSFLGGPAGTDWRPRTYGEETATAIDVAVRELMDTAFQKASSILTARRPVLEGAAAELLTKETLTGDELAALAAKLALPAAGEKGPPIAAIRGQT